jgi:hypothetical protein
VRIQRCGERANERLGETQTLPGHVVFDDELAAQLSQRTLKDIRVLYRNHEKHEV